MTRELETIVASAMVSTITMPVAADRPPMKTSSASAGCSAASGRASRKASASVPPSPKVSSPATAIGSTKTLMSSMYSGNSHIAFLT